MRSLERNKRNISYALLTGTEPIKDDYGNDTLEIKRVYSEFTEYKANISSAVGEEAVMVFGSQTNYSRTISVADRSCPFAVEGARILYNSKTYEVVKVADSVNGFFLAVREVV